MKFSVPMYGKLIELVRNHTCLYDSSMAEYKDHTLQKNIWKGITKEMNEESMSWEAWKKIWKQRRDFFTRKRRAIQLCKSGSAAKKIKTGPLYEQMTFLADHVAGRSTVSNLSQYSSDSSDEDQSNSDDNTVEDEEENTQISDVEASDDSDTQRSISSRPVTPHGSVSPLPPSSSQANPKTTPANRTSKSATLKITAGKAKKGNKKNAMELDDFIGQIKQRSASNMETINKIATKLINEDDDDTNIFQYLSKRMKTFTKETQEWLEDEVMRLYMEAKRRERTIRSPASMQQQQQQQQQPPPEQLQQQQLPQQLQHQQQQQLGCYGQQAHVPVMMDQQTGQNFFSL